MSKIIENAIKIITDELKKDKSVGSYYYTWQANIAMAFKDEFDRKGKGYTSRATVHLLANNAACNFLNLLCSSAEKTESNENR
jgi:hypothetical protein